MREIWGKLGIPYKVVNGQPVFETDLSDATIQEKIAELQADYDSKQYERDRANAYPSWQDQLDNIFHNGIDAWKADIQAIKDQFPKP